MDTHSHQLRGPVLFRLGEPVPPVGQTFALVEFRNASDNVLGPDVVSVYQLDQAGHMARSFSQPGKALMANLTAQAMGVGLASGSLALMSHIPGRIKKYCQRCQGVLSQEAQLAEAGPPSFCGFEHQQSAPAPQDTATRDGGLPGTCFQDPVDPVSRPAHRHHGHEPWPRQRPQPGVLRWSVSPPFDFLFFFCFPNILFFLVFSTLLRADQAVSFATPRDHDSFLGAVAIARSQTCAWPSRLWKPTRPAMPSSSPARCPTVS